MAAERLQVVADAFEDWNARDYDAAVEHFAEDCEWHVYLKALGSDVFRGRQGVVGMFRQVTEELGLTMNFRQMHELGDHVLVDVLAEPTGEHEDVTDGASWFQLFSFSDGLISKVEPFKTRDEAVAAAGGDPR